VLSIQVTFLNNMIKKKRGAKKGTIPWNKGTKMSKEEYNLGRLRWSHKNKERRQLQSQRSHLKRKFNITINDYNEMLRNQNNRCAICGIKQTYLIDRRGRKKSNLNVDHNHDTGNVRGLLCQKCNSGLGYFSDSTDNLEKAIKYLSSR